MCDWKTAWIVRGREISAKCRKVDRTAGGTALLCSRTVAQLVHLWGAPWKLETEMPFLLFYPYLPFFQGIRGEFFLPFR